MDNYWLLMTFQENDISKSCKIMQSTYIFFFISKNWFIPHANLCSAHVPSSHLLEESAWLVPINHLECHLGWNHMVWLFSHINTLKNVCLCFYLLLEVYWIGSLLWTINVLFFSIEDIISYKYFFIYKKS